VAGLDTRSTGAGIAAFLAEVNDGRRCADARKIAAMRRRATGKRAKMRGPGIVGYGRYRYRYAGEREGRFMITGFSLHRQRQAVNIIPGYAGHSELLAKHGKYRTGKFRLYATGPEDVVEKVLDELIVESVRDMQSKYDTK